MNINFTYRSTKAEIKPTSILITKCLEGPNELLASTIEGTTLGDGVVEVHGNEIGGLDEGRGPPRTINTTV